MIDVQRDDEAFFAGAQRFEPLLRDEIRRGERNARMNAQPLHMRYCAQALGHGAQATRRRRQRIAARENDLGNLPMRRDIVQRDGKRCGVECTALADSLAAEAETAIDGTDGDELQQDAVAITMHDAGNGAVRLIADRVAELGGSCVQFPHVGQELPRDRVARIGAVDERRDLRRDGDIVARLDSAQPL